MRSTGFPTNGVAIVPLVAAFIATFAIVYLVQQSRGKIMLDRLHLATLCAMGVTVLILIGAIVFGG